VTPYWRDEKHGLEIYHGDCLEVMPALEREFNLCVTDPPYNRAQSYAATTDALDASAYEEWSRLWWCCARRRVATLVFTCGMQNVGMWEKIKQPTWWVAWDTTNRLLKRTPIGYSRWEPVAVYGKAKQMRPDIFKAPIISDEFAGDHPCPKPVAWATWLVETFSAAGEVVVDPFTGTGIVLAACIPLGRQGVGIEISEEYCELAAKRLETEIAQGRLFEPEEVNAQPTQEELFDD